MKSYLKLIPMLLMLMFGAVVSESAMARGGHGGGGHSGGGRSGGYSHGGGYVRGYGGLGLGIALAPPIYGLGYYSNPYYSYPYTYPDPAYAYQGPAMAPSSGYVVQGIPQTAPPPTQAQAQAQGDWYFCTASNAYYPYVRECPGGWQRVPSQPPAR